MIQRLCVYCGSSPGKRTEYTEGAKQLANSLVEQGIGLVYGGGNVGIMGLLADAVMTQGGHTIGVIPTALLEKELAHQGLTELRVVNSMHERKALMAELADAFIALPGGLGTLDELFEILTWAQLGLHQKPCGLLNIHQYYDKLISFLDHMVSEEYVKGLHRSMLLVETEPQKLLERFRSQG
ncbi:MAG: TIGR00730 family Rossman fold protein [SAR324 cluster bacterium]|nr:TIGR00730 family Rossman fold protein [SAR324 cluster bacterium]